MKIFNENGWINMEECFNSTPFVIIISGRGLGKTFGALKYLVDRYRETGEKFMYMRRLEAEADIVASREGNPFEALNRELGYNVTVKKISKDVNGFFLDDRPDPCGIIVALSTFYRKRSVAFNDVTNIFFDEFIPEKNARPIRGEAEAFFNAVESVNRNRELRSEEPVHCVLASNSNTVDNPILLSLNLVNRVMDMVRKKVPIWTDEKRGLTVITPFNSPITAAKSETALYRLTSSGRNDFTRMALRNEFGEEISDNVKPMNLKQFTPVCSVGELYVYRHKTERKYYVSSHGSGTFAKVYSIGDMGLKRFKREQSRLWMAHLRSSVYFESFVEQMLFESYFA